ncbi:TIGR01906 family membrane protein [Pseudoflavonifractor sp. 60]|uniref:TIGR01906 family membrane protein n=1 Tax=Pseudoflavonifractor sp. 60 TaxID=2304576 RepID=UPI001370F31E|nr:TIGR01906 family membrane protein [Pseudoflavonifractor sp. 60]NBI65755.1 TIGR01906 family membrane protein [Pseudoflavonifractor sp. 60]
MKIRKLLSLLLSVLIALVVLTGSIAMPLLCRSFYYAHIGPMGLEDWGLTRAEIETAYNEMMDFCLGKREDFSAGVLAFSQSGADHFADVRGLFLLDLRVLKISVMALGFLLGWCMVGKVRPHRFLDRGPGFWAAAGLGVSFLAVGGLAALDFDRAFVIFHSIFFPGKDNWIFDWQTDPIILFLPQDFFRNCALLILGLLLLWCGALIAADSWARNGGKNR